jgi:hypothetical protein
MSPEAKAKIFTKALAETGDVVAAFRLAEEAGRRPRRMNPERIAQLRAGRARGRKLLDLALDFGISETHACLLCRGVVVEAAGPPVPPPVAVEILRIVGQVLFSFEPGWERIRRRGWGRRSVVGSARRVAILAMHERGLSIPDIAAVFDRRQTEIRELLEAGQQDHASRRMCEQVTAELAAGAQPGEAATAAAAA